MSAQASTFWPGTRIEKSTGNGFTIPARSLYAGDKSEAAKATMARNESLYGQATDAVGHGAEVMSSLSEKAKKRLKAVPFSQPITPKSKKARP